MIVGFSSDFASLMAAAFSSVITSPHNRYFILALKKPAVAKPLSIFGATGYNIVIMKVIFLKNVANMAKAGEVKEVANGYGRNFLLPRNLALLATSSAIKTAEVQIQKEREKQALFAAELDQLAQQLEGFAVNFKAKVVEEDRLYGSIRDGDIADELSQLTGLEIERKQVELEEPIRHLGEYEVTVRLSKDLAPTIKVIIAQED